MSGSSGDSAIDVEDVVWRPSAEVIESSRLTRFMRPLGIDTYEELLARSVADPDWFWDAAVKDMGVDFYRPYDKVLDTSRGLMWGRWWTGGEMNVVHSCLDRYAGTEIDNKIGLIWEGEAGEVRTRTYEQLRTEMDDLAGGMKALGIQVGDRVGVFMPMIPEVAIAVLACAKIGAVWVGGPFGATERL
jgi:acetyl-CoA synthetase